MDDLRSCYKTKARFFSTDPLNISDIEWYFVPDDRAYLPVRSVFGSLNWSDKAHDHGGVGEVGGRPRPWRNGQDVMHLRALRTCTPDAWFVDGAPFPDPAYHDPSCCAQPRGRLQLGFRLRGRTRTAQLLLGLGMPGVVRFPPAGVAELALGLELVGGVVPGRVELGDLPLGHVLYGLSSTPDPEPTEEFELGLRLSSRVIPQNCSGQWWCLCVRAHFFNADCSSTEREICISWCMLDDPRIGIQPITFGGACGPSETWIYVTQALFPYYVPSPWPHADNLYPITLVSVTRGLCSPPTLQGLPLGRTLRGIAPYGPPKTGFLPLGHRLSSSSHFTPPASTVTTACCPSNPTSTALKATLTVAGCACLNGAVVNLDYQSSGADMGKWTGTGDPCAGSSTAFGIKLRCESGAMPSWHVELTGCLATIFDPPPQFGGVCSPLQLIFDGFGVPSGCCPGGGGALTLTVTITPR